MSDLNKHQIRFLEEHNISLKSVFDAKGLKKSEYSNLMKDLNKIVAFNVTPCSKFGHTLRTRAGHCCQCNPAYLEFQKRNDAEGIVYIAMSQIGKIVKIGFTKSVDIRSESLNRTEYGGLNDWKIIYAIESKDAGKIENKICSELSEFSHYIYYEHDNHTQLASEIFNINSTQAIKILHEVCNVNNFKFKILVNKKNIQKWKKYLLLDYWYEQFLHSMVLF